MEYQVNATMEVVFHFEADSLEEAKANAEQETVDTFSVNEFSDGAILSVKVVEVQILDEE
jgi:hypothetical protein